MSKWKIWPADKRCIRDSLGTVVARCPSGDVAEDIVREHEAHAALLAACKGMRDWMAQSGISMNGTDADMAIALAEATP